MRLGMSPEEALQALVAFSSISPDDININLIESHIPIIEVQNVAYEYRYLSEGELVYVRFTPSLAHKDVGYMVVSDVRVTIDSIQSVEDGAKQSAKWQKDVTEKYGPLSIERNRSAYWCAAHIAGEKRCDNKSASLSVQNLYRPEMFLSNREYRRLWSEELEKWANESDKAGTIKYGSEVYNITTHVCRRKESIKHENCKVGEPDGDTVEILLFDPSRKRVVDRSTVFKIVDVSQSEIGDKIGILFHTMSSKGEDKGVGQIRYADRVEACDLVELKTETVTLNCENETFDVKKEWAIGLKNY